MHVTLTVKHVRRDASLDEAFDREASRIVRRLSGVAMDLVSLHCEIERNVHMKECYASLTLTVPSEAMNARGVGPNVYAALKDAVDDVLVELKRYRQQQRRRDRTQQSFRLSAISDPDAMTVKVNGRVHEDLSVEIRRTMPELYTFVRRQLQRHADVLDLPEIADVDVSDVVEEAVTEALERRDRKGEVPFDRFLITCAYEVLTREEERVRQWRKRVSLEDEVQPVSSPEGETTGEEILLERMADHALLSDVLLDGGQRSMDEVVGGRDLRLAVLKAIRRLPDPSRKVLSLLALEGIAEREAAQRMHCTEENIRETIADARVVLRNELTMRGYEL